MDETFLYTAWLRRKLVYCAAHWELTILCTGTLCEPEYYSRQEIFPLKNLMTTNLHNGLNCFSLIKSNLITSLYYSCVCKYSR